MHIIVTHLVTLLLVLLLPISTTSFVLYIDSSIVVQKTQLFVHTTTTIKTHYIHT